MSISHVPILSELHLVPALECILRHRSVTRAAEEMGITQSAMSHKLRRLRELLDDPILVRGAQGMVLTDRAALLEPSLGPVLHTLRDVLKEPPEFSPETSDRTFVMAASDGIEVTVLPALLERIRQAAPSVRLELVRSGPDMWQRMERGEVDAAVAPPLEAPAGFLRRVVSDDEFVVLARENHPRLANGLTLELYLELPHVLVSPRGGPGIVDAMLAKRGLERHVLLQTPYFAGAPFVVAGSDCVMTAQRPMAEQFARHLPVTIHPCPIDVPTIPIYLYFHSRQKADPGHLWLRELAFSLIS